MTQLAVRIGRWKLKNPVMVCSGTFGYAQEFKDYLELGALGAIVTKTITLEPRKGNPPPRTCETPCGLLNSIGLENPGIDVFLREKLPLLQKTNAPIMVSIAAQRSQKEFLELARLLEKERSVAAIELNISCPNIKQAGERPGQVVSLVSQDPVATRSLVRGVRRMTRKTLVTKLSPNVTSIADIACAAQAGGSDAVALINTLTGMSIDIRRRSSKIACVTGGLSGPAIRPVALRMVWEAYQKITIPIIGMGGIMDAASAIEFFIAGATAVSVGTANFINPSASQEILRGIKKYLTDCRIKKMQELIGSLKT